MYQVNIFDKIHNHLHLDNYLYLMINTPNKNNYRYAERRYRKKEKVINIIKFNVNDYSISKNIKYNCLTGCFNENKYYLLYNNKINIYDLKTFKLIHIIDIDVDINLRIYDDFKLYHIMDKLILLCYDKSKIYIYDILNKNVINIDYDNLINSVFESNNSIIILNLYIKHTYNVKNNNLRKKYISQNFGISPFDMFKNTNYNFINQKIYTPFKISKNIFLVNYKVYNIVTDEIIYELPKDGDIYDLLKFFDKINDLYIIDDKLIKIIDGNITNYINLSTENVTFKENNYSINKYIPKDILLLRCKNVKNLNINPVFKYIDQYIDYIKTGIVKYSEIINLINICSVLNDIDLLYLINIYIDKITNERDIKIQKIYALFEFLSNDMKTNIKEYYLLLNFMLYNLDHFEIIENFKDNNIIKYNYKCMITYE